MRHNKVSLTPSNTGKVTVENMSRSFLRSIDVLCSDGETRKARFPKGVEPKSGAEAYVYMHGKLHYGFVVEEFPDHPEIPSMMEFISDIEVEETEQEEQKTWDNMSDEERKAWDESERQRFEQMMEDVENGQADEGKASKRAV